MTTIALVALQVIGVVALLAAVCFVFVGVVHWGMDDDEPNPRARWPMWLWVGVGLWGALCLAGVVGLVRIYMWLQ